MLLKVKVHVYSGKENTIKVYMCRSFIYTHLTYIFDHVGWLRAAAHESKLTRVSFCSHFAQQNKTVTLSTFCAINNVAIIFLH